MNGLSNLGLGVNQNNTNNSPSIFLVKIIPYSEVVLVKAYPRKDLKAKILIRTRTDNSPSYIL